MGIQASPYSTMWRKCRSVGDAPTMIGGWGCCTGLGHDHDASKFTYSPAKLASSRVHSSLQARIFSRTTLRRRPMSTPWLSISSWFQPYPTPKRKRPFDNWSSVATSFASHNGSRWATRVMPVANLIDVVTAAAAARARNWSCVRQYSSGSGGAPSRPPQGVRRDTGMCECSGNHSDRKPLVSASRASSTGWMPLSVGKMTRPMSMLRP